MEVFEWRGEIRDGSTQYSKTGPKKSGTPKGVKRRCKMCGELGHMAKTCGRPEPEVELKRTLRCGNCGQFGHNRMTCTNERDASHVPQQYKVKGTTRCSRCGVYGHNVAKCTQTEVTHPDRFCSGCGEERPMTHHGFKPGMCLKCSRKARSIKPRPCISCGVDFVPRESNRKVCSDQCKRAYLSKIHSDAYERLTGQVFGWWTVLLHESADHCVARCRCGFERRVSTHALKHGGSESCRRCAAKKRMEEMTDEQRELSEVKARAAKNRDRVWLNKTDKASVLGVAVDAADFGRRWLLYKRDERKKLLNEYKRAPCMDCGGLFPPVCMDFDHRPGEQKVAGLSKMIIQAAAFETIIDEIKKCDLVCSNCHRIRTHSRMLEKEGRTDEHGSLSHQVSPTQMS